MRIKKQNDEKDCGIVCLQSFYKKYHHKWLDLNFFKTTANYSNGGINLLDLQECAKHFGLFIDILEGDYQSFLNLKLSEPLLTILKIDNRLHYSIILSKNDNFIILLDPIKGRMKVTLNEFQNWYMDVIMTVKADPNYSYLSIKHRKTDVCLFDVKYTLFSIFISIAIFIISILCSQIMKTIIDQIIPSQEKTHLKYILILFLWLTLIKSLLFFVNYILSQKIYRTIHLQLNKMFVHKLLNGKIAEIEKISQADMLQRFTFLSSIAEYESNVFIFVCSNIICLLFSCILLIYVNNYLFLICFLFFIIIFSISLAYKILIKKNIENLIIKNRDYLKTSIDAVTNFKCLRMTYEKYKYQEKLATLLNSQTLSERWYKNQNSTKNLLINFITSLVPMILFYCGVLLIFNKRIKLGDVILFTTLFNFICDPINKISDLIANKNNIREQKNRLSYVLNISTEQNNLPFIQLTDINQITLKNFSFGFSKFTKILNIKEQTLTKHTIITGNNGCGKSTLLNILYKLYDYDGNIKVDRNELKSINIDEWRINTILLKNSSFIHSDNVYNFLTLNNVSLQNNLYFADQKYKLNKLLNKINIDFYSSIENYGDNFSEGQKTLINVLKIFTHNPKMVLLDEVFDNLHPSIFNELKAILQDYLKDKMVIEISHNERYIFNENKVTL
ncbi:Mbov_0121 family peptidase domain-containing ABC transporter [Mycoplasma phocoenae]|uniref:ATP-binding cassette domain-containing protein n=1 Tax=Mycoplasma phocoenae TaxID=754517 RepID=A0A858U2Z7_9MOLU|nr:cysteine peptidase family C39 domain-containing protein [Mycoplasma phocoenae]QJG66792.1 ATP-binding cassette domain-containing protein [Mycoplasma phocoenae]